MGAERSALGKGLASLLPGVAHPVSSDRPIPPSTEKEIEAPGAANRDRHPGISMADPDLIQPNPYQPRRAFSEREIAELAESIEANGLIQPLVVRKDPLGGYQLIAGERRLRAAKKAGLKQVPIVIRRTTDRESLELAIVENVQRSDLNCVETATAYQRLQKEFSLTQEEIAKRVGKDRTSVANHLRVLTLPSEIQEDLKTGKMSFGHAKAILAVEGEFNRKKIWKILVEKGLSVRDAEKLIQAHRDGLEKEVTPPSRPPSAVEARLKNMAQELSRQWITKVEVHGDEKRGKIIVHYHSREELERLLQSMQS